MAWHHHHISLYCLYPRYFSHASWLLIWTERKFVLIFRTIKNNQHMRCSVNESKLLHLKESRKSVRSVPPANFVNKGGRPKSEHILVLHSIRIQKINFLRCWCGGGGGDVVVRQRSKSNNRVYRPLYSFMAANRNFKIKCDPALWRSPHICRKRQLDVDEMVKFAKMHEKCVSIDFITMLMWKCPEMATR